MAADFSYWMNIASDAVTVFFFAVVAGVVCFVFIYGCFLMVKACWQSPRIRIPRLGGVTILTRNLDYPCLLCRDSMEAGEKVRTLSCDHAFHCGGSVKCVNDIDHWLRTAPRMSCPICRQDPQPVPEGKQPPPSSPAPSSSASVSTSTPELVEPLLRPTHDETLPDASSSAPAPPLAQSPPTSKPDLEEALPLPADDEILPDASSS